MTPMFCLDLSPNQKMTDVRACLNSGHQMPIISCMYLGAWLGTFQLTGRCCVLDSIDAALKAGYRGIDTAAVYRNEKDIGYALKKLLPKYGLKREDIFITTKLAPSDHGDEERVTNAVKTSLEYLDVEYIDLYLIHWPGAAGYSPSDCCNITFRTNTWKHLVKIYDEGRGPLRSIGVSNYTTTHLMQLLADSPIIPAVNQVEFHPHYQQSKGLYNVSRKNRILLQAYSSLGGTCNSSLLRDPIVKHIAYKNHMTPAQVLLRWALQRCYAVVPKSTHPCRIAENAALETELSHEDMTSLNNIGHKEKYAWDPEIVA